MWGRAVLAQRLTQKSDRRCTKRDVMATKPEDTQQEAVGSWGCLWEMGPKMPHSIVPAPQRTKPWKNLSFLPIASARGDKGCCERGLQKCGWERRKRKGKAEAPLMGS